VFESKKLRRMFGPKRDEVTGEWRKLHVELHNVHFPRDIIRMLKSVRWASYVACVEELKNAFRILV
jgi:hypothetical protein